VVKPGGAAGEAGAIYILRVPWRKTIPSFEVSGSYNLISKKPELAPWKQCWREHFRAYRSMAV